ncbi:MAG: hypothetical protein SF066_07455 [Thermoanaerobaculia bacterium]|nr:hypothetical protein [Thermoanaerobaculia bacterium]
MKTVDFEDTSSEDQSREEALFSASEVLSAMLAWRFETRKEFPAPNRNLSEAGMWHLAPRS